MSNTKLKEVIIKLGEDGKYEMQGRYFVQETGLEIERIYVGTKKHFTGDTEKRDVFEIIVKRNDKHFSFSFGASIKDTEENFNRGSRRLPSYYSILTCLEKYEPEEDIDDFASELGIEKPSEAIRIHAEVRRQWKEMSAMFTEYELEVLREIQ